MRTYFPYLLLLLTVTLQCFSQNNDQRPDNRTELTKALKKIDLPFSSECGNTLITYDGYSLKPIINNLPGNLDFAGLLKMDKNFSAILLVDNNADIQNHYLITISDEGNIIDNFFLFSHGCSEDEYFTGQAKYTIDKELRIIQADSSATFKRDSKGEIVDTTIKISTNKYQYFINKYGKIRKSET
jgi:hypothetical protein